MIDETPVGSPWRIFSEVFPDVVDTFTVPEYAYVWLYIPNDQPAFIKGNFGSYFLNEEERDNLIERLKECAFNGTSARAAVLEMKKINDERRKEIESRRELLVKEI